MSSDRESPGSAGPARSLAKSWLDEYAQMRPGYRVGALKPFTILLMVIGVVAILWSVPTPAAFNPVADVLNWGTLFIMAAIVYYFIVSLPLAVGILPFMVGVVAAVAWLDRLYTPLWTIGIALVVLALFGQFVEHFRHGRRAPYFRELQLAMIAPLWLLAVLYRRLGIRY